MDTVTTPEERVDGQWGKRVESGGMEEGGPGGLLCLE